MTNKIEQQITAFAVKTTEAPPMILKPIERPDELKSTTYKIKSLDQSFYISIADMNLNGVLHPYEVFINTKSVEHTPYLTAITRLISAFLRTGYPYHFIAEELQQIHDAKDGNYWKKGQCYPSLIAEIGAILQKHFDEVEKINVTTT